MRTAQFSLSTLLTASKISSQLPGYCPSVGTEYGEIVPLRLKRPECSPYNLIFAVFQNLSEGFIVGFNHYFGSLELYLGE